MTPRYLPIQINPVTGTAALAGWGAGYTVRFLRLLPFVGARRKRSQPPGTLGDVLRDTILAQIQRTGARVRNGEIDELVKSVIKLLEKVFGAELGVDAIPCPGELPQIRRASPDFSAPLIQRGKGLSEAKKATLRKILVVQDSPSSLKHIAGLLSRYGDCMLATNGKAGLRLFRKALEEMSPFDLVCLDITTPETNGHAVLKRIRSLETAKGILGPDGARVIVITTSDDPSTITKAFREQYEAYLIRPVTEEKLESLAVSLGLMGDNLQQ